MQATSSNISGTRRWAETLYLILAGLILLGIVLQGFLIGAYLFGGADWGVRIHSVTGFVVLLLALLLALDGLLTHIPVTMKVGGFVLFVLVIVQNTLPSFSGNVPLLAALHPANAMILFGLTLFLRLRVQQLLRTA